MSSISSISMSADFNQGMTTAVSISGDGGAQSFSGQEFKDIFNVRAPANIQIVGPLFNIEVKWHSVSSWAISEGSLDLF